MSPLLSIDEFEAVRHAENTVVFDCRFSLADFSLGRQQYLAGHIPGAFFLDMETDLSGRKDAHSGRHPLPTLEDFREKLMHCGVDNHSQIICYDENKFAGAARLWWLLRYFGLENVRVLDGGLTSWRASGGEFTSEVPETVSSDSLFLEPGHLALVPMSSLVDALEQSTLIDSREGFRFRGEQEPIDPVAGRIPGAINYFWAEVVDEQGRLKATKALKEYWRPVFSNLPVVAYCGSGVTAAVNVLSMHQAGFTDVALYNGSWSQWCSYKHNPVERDS